MTLFVDYRDQQDRSGPLIPVLRQYIVPASDVQETKMEFGDAAFVGEGPKGTIIRFGIEIKHIADVLQCMDDGRFTGVDGQLPGLVQDYDHYWLLVEDDLRPEPRTGVLQTKIPQSRRKGQRNRRFMVGKQLSPEAASEKNGHWVSAQFGGGRTILYSHVMKWLIELSTIAGVHLWRTKSRDETAQWIVANYKEWQKPWEAHKALRCFNNAHVDPRSMYVNSEVIQLAKMIATYDGVGFERAMVLARKFKSRDEFNKADEAQYIVRDTVHAAGIEKKVSIGKKTAAAIKEQMMRKRR